MRFDGLDALRNPAFRRLWLSRWLWNTSRVLQITVVPWLMLELTNSPAQVSLVGVVRMAPMFLLGLVAGGLADRFSTARVMAAAHALGSGTSLLILLAVWAGRVTSQHLLLASFAAGVAGAIDFPAKRAYLAKHFSGSGLMNALSLDNVAFQGSNTIGPIIGGSLIALAGYTTTFAILSTIQLAEFVCILTLPGDAASHGPASASSLDRSVLGVTRRLWTSPAIQMVVLTTMTLNLFCFPCLDLIPVVARDVLGVGSSLYGALRSARGLGSLMGALTLASIAIRRRMDLFIIGTAVMLVGFLALGMTSAYGVSLALLLLSGLGSASFGTMQSTIVLHAAPDDLRGRAMGIVALAIGIGPVGTLMAGFLAERVGAQATIRLLPAIGLVVFSLLARRARRSYAEAP